MENGKEQRPVYAWTDRQNRTTIKQRFLSMLSIIWIFKQKLFKNRSLSKETRECRSNSSWTIYSLLRMVVKWSEWQSQIIRVWISQAHWATQISQFSFTFSKGTQVLSNWERIKMFWDPEYIAGNRNEWFRWSSAKTARWSTSQNPGGSKTREESHSSQSWSQLTLDIPKTKPVYSIRAWMVHLLRAMLYTSTGVTLSRRLLLPPTQ